MADQLIGLAEAIAGLRQELLRASESGEGSDARFHISSIDVSLQVAATKGSSGKIGWTVIGLGASYESATTQTLTLTLEPLWRKPDGTYTNDFAVSGQRHLTEAFGPRNAQGDAP